MKVRVYWNLHKKCWSLQELTTRKVVAHRASLVLADCTFNVGKKGRLRVLETKRKNVHAFVTGRLTDITYQQALTGERPITYNPFTHEHFECEGTPVSAARWVSFKPDKTVSALGIYYQQP